jgi:hypothetical protein
MKDPRKVVGKEAMLARLSATQQERHSAVMRVHQLALASAAQSVRLTDYQLAGMLGRVKVSHYNYSALMNEYHIRFSINENTAIYLGMDMGCLVGFRDGVPDGLLIGCLDGCALGC